MKRREFLERVGCGAAGFAAAPIDLNSSAESESQEPRRYQYEIEIFEAREDTWCHKKGDRFRYPDDYGQLCTWLRGSMDKFLAAMEQGGELWWRYEGTPYELVSSLHPRKLGHSDIRAAVRNQPQLLDWF